MYEHILIEGLVYVPLRVLTSGVQVQLLRARATGHMERKDTVSRTCTIDIDLREMRHTE